MDLKEVPLLANGADTHWYYAAKSAALLRCVGDRLPRRVLDVGAGSGFFAKTLLQQTPAQSAICLDTGYSDEWSELVEGKAVDFRRGVAAPACDLVLLMDVLEHVDDDGALLRHYVDSAPPGARFVVSVPAFSWLWSAHDTFLQHRRRYTLDQLLRLVADAGLEPLAGFYFFAAVFPAAALRRLLGQVAPAGRVPASDLREHHPWLNAFLLRVCLAESRIARHNRRFGLTAFAVAEKPGAGAGEGRRAR